jgi:predicted nucleic-acid-binding protein
MVLFDTNVILRYILQDNQEMAQRVEQQLVSDVCFIPVEVVAEMVYVLSKVYSVERKVIAQTIMDITNSDDIMVAQDRVVRHALRVYASTTLDFVDCLLTGYAKEERYTVFTFDKQLQKYLKE